MAGAALASQLVATVPGALPTPLVTTKVTVPTSEVRLAVSPSVVIAEDAADVLGPPVPSACRVVVLPGAVARGAAPPTLANAMCTAAIMETQSALPVEISGGSLWLTVVIPTAGPIPEATCPRLE